MSWSARLGFLYCLYIFANMKEAKMNLERHYMSS